MSLKYKISDKLSDLKDWLLTTFVAKPFVFLFSDLEKYITYKRPKYPIPFWKQERAVKSRTFALIKDAYYSPYFDENEVYYKKVSSEDCHLKNVLSGNIYHPNEDDGFGYFTPITDCKFDGTITKEYYTTHSDEIYQLITSYKKEPKLYSIKHNFQWQRMRRHALWYSKHVLDNDAEYGSMEPLKKDKNWKYYYIARMKQIWSRFFPEVSFYQEPASLTYYIENVLVKFAIYCFYTGHTTANKEMIRKCWALRKELRSIGDEESKYKKEKVKQLSESFAQKYNLENHHLKYLIKSAFDEEDDPAIGTTKKALFSDEWYIINPLSHEVKFTDDELYDCWTKVPETKGKLVHLLESECLENPEEALSWVNEQWKSLEKEYYANLKERMDTKKKQVFELVALQYERLWD